MAKLYWTLWDAARPGVYVCVHVTEDRPSSFHFFRYFESPKFNNCRSRINSSFFSWRNKLKWWKCFITWSPVREWGIEYRIQVFYSFSLWNLRESWWLTQLHFVKVSVIDNKRKPKCFWVVSAVGSGVSSCLE